MTSDRARRIAANIAKLPGPLAARRSSFAAFRQGSSALCRFTLLEKCRGCIFCYIGQIVRFYVDSNYIEHDRWFSLGQKDCRYLDR